MEKGHAICIAGIRSATQKQAATQWEERFRDRGRKSRVSEGARSCSGQIPKERDRKKEKQHLTQKGRLTQKCRWTQLNSNDCSACKDLTGEEGILGRKKKSQYLIRGIIIISLAWLTVPASLEVVPWPGDGSSTTGMLAFHPGQLFYSPDRLLL